jgi:hypothetical protein
MNDNGDTALLSNTGVGSVEADSDSDGVNQTRVRLTTSLTPTAICFESPA